MQEQTINVLTQKIGELVEKYQELQAQNEFLRQELVKEKAQSEAKSVQIAKLENDLISKDVNADDLLSKIEAVLKKWIRLRSASAAKITILSWRAILPFNLKKTLKSVLKIEAPSILKSCCLRMSVNVTTLLCWKTKSLNWYES